MRLFLAIVVCFFAVSPAIAQVSCPNCIVVAQMQDRASEQKEYDSAFDMLRQKQYLDAQMAFQNFIELHPQSVDIQKAKYWYAEALYAQSKFVEAARAFTDAYTENPQGQKAPDCLLKKALIASYQNKSAEACAYVGELIQNYPNSSPNVLAHARELSQKISCNESYN